MGSINLSYLVHRSERRGGAFSPPPPHTHLDVHSSNSAEDGRVLTRVPLGYSVFSHTRPAGEEGTDSAPHPSGARVKTVAPTRIEQSPESVGVCTSTGTHAGSCRQALTPTPANQITDNSKGMRAQWLISRARLHRALTAAASCLTPLGGSALGWRELAQTSA